MITRPGKLNNSNTRQFTQRAFLLMQKRLPLHVHFRYELCTYPTNKAHVLT